MALAAKVVGSIVLYAMLSQVALAQVSPNGATPAIRTTEREPVVPKAVPPSPGSEPRLVPGPTQIPGPKPPSSSSNSAPGPIPGSSNGGLSPPGDPVR
jgi:hypothetical protein